jgi:hypothetical protein
MLARHGFASQRQEPVSVFKSMLIVCAGAVAAVSLSAAPVAAQSSTSQNSGQNEQSDRASGRVSGERVLPGRVGGQEEDNNRRRNRRGQQQQQGPTPEQNRDAAQAIANAAGAECQVTEASLLGQRGEGELIFEAACATGPGYILSGTTPPAKNDCVGLAGAAYLAREADPAADAGLQCTLPANQNAMAVIGGYAQQAGVTCQIDQALAFQVNKYEVGCAGQDGYWIEKQAAGWIAVPCWDLTLDNNRCRFTTPEESLSAWPQVLAGSDAAACAVEQVRKIGIDGEQRGVYELKCTGADGWIVRVDAAGATKLVHACSDPMTVAIQRGCQLSPQAGGVELLPATPQQ